MIIGHVQVVVATMTSLTAASDLVGTILAVDAPVAAVVYVDTLATRTPELRRAAARCCKVVRMEVRSEGVCKTLKQAGATRDVTYDIRLRPIRRYTDFARRIAGHRKYTRHLCTGSRRNHTEALKKKER